MVKYKVYTLGCKVSQAEGDQIKSILENYGLTETNANNNPDLCVINTCAVTSRAEGKSRRLIKRLSRKFPDAHIIVLGCYATLIDKSITKLPQVKLIADHTRTDILTALEKYLKANISTSNHPTKQPQFHLKSSRHRALLKIQDGCDASCTYCIIPKLRPNVKSITIEEAITLANELIQQGHREIVLCGIFLGAFGKSTAKKKRLRETQPLVELIYRLTELPGLGRLRLSSLEPLDLTDELLLAIRSSTKIAKHLHLPLQSGSDKILKRMGRQYHISDYLDAIEKTKAYIPDIAFTTDIIVGFPEESDRDFQETIRIAEKVGFLKMHIFPFSPREGTPAYNWKHLAPPTNIIRNRIKVLANLDKTLRRKFIKNFIGKEVRVLVERIEKKGSQFICSGRADQYFEVCFESQRSCDNKFVIVEGKKLINEILVGKNLRIEDNEYTNEKRNA